MYLYDDLEEDTDNMMKKFQANVNYEALKGRLLRNNAYDNLKIKNCYCHAIQFYLQIFESKDVEFREDAVNLLENYPQT